MLTSLILIIAFALTFISQKYFYSFISYENNRFVGYCVGSISANYGFILGFIIVTLWRELYDLKSLVVQEAEYVSLIFYNSSAFPNNIQDEIINEISQYIRIMIQDEWPLMRYGKVSPKVIPLFSKLFHTIQSYTPNTQVESAFYNQFINNLNKVIEFRRKRLEYLDSSLSDIIRFMLIFGAVVILSLISLLYAGSNKIKILSLTLVSCMLSLNLSLALLLDYPFSSIPGDDSDLFAVNSHPFKAGILKKFDPESKNIDPPIFK